MSTVENEKWGNGYSFFDTRGKKHLLLVMLVIISTV